MYANAVTVMQNKSAGRPITPNKKDKIVKVTIASAASIPPTTRIVVAITTTAIGIQMGAKSSTATRSNSLQTSFKRLSIVSPQRRSDIWKKNSNNII